MKNNRKSVIVISAGYMYKRVAPAPAWLNASHVNDIFAVANCISPSFCDYVPFWQHNGFWFFDNPRQIAEIAAENAVPLVGLTLFFYAVYPLQWHHDKQIWEPFAPEPSLKTDVVNPRNAMFVGVDVVSFNAQSSPECSPLTCNGLAQFIDVNAHGLLEDTEQAKDLLRRGAFEHAEPGPYRVFEVYTVDCLHDVDSDKAI